MENAGSNPPLKRDSESLDDFEHLGHDSSPLQEFKQHTGDLLGLKTSREDTHVTAPKIDTENTKFSTSTLPQAGDSLLDQPLIPETMDSNILDMNNSFPDRKAADEKLDKFLQEMSAPFAAPEPLKPQKIDSNTLYSFLDNERGELKDLVQEKDEKGSTELLEKYSDSEPESDDFKISNTKKSTDMLDQLVADSESHKFTDTFKDIDESVPPQISNIKDNIPPPQLDNKKETEVKNEPIKEISEPVKKVEPINIDTTAQEQEKKKDPSPKTELPKVAVPSKNAEKQKIIEAEVLFCKMGLDAWFNPDRLNPKVEGLIYWRDPKKSGPVFGGVLLVLLALTYFSLISVVAYLSLLALTGTIAFRIYKNIVQAVQKTGDGHPFKDYLEQDVSLSQEKVREVSEIAVAHLNAGFVELRRLFLVEDLVDSIKFGVLLWVLTYLGSWFNGMTLVIIAWVALFSLPKVYEANQAQIDANLDIVRTKIAEITTKVKAAIPIGKKSEKEEKKE